MSEEPTSFSDKTKFKMSVAHLLSGVGAIVASVAIATWVVAGVLNNVKESIQELHQECWTVADHNEYTAQLSELNPSLKVPNVLKVKETVARQHGGESMANH